MLAVHLGLYLWLLVLGVSTQCKQSIPGMTLCHKEAEKVGLITFALHSGHPLTILFLSCFRDPGDVNMQD